MSEQDAEYSPMRTEASHRNAALNDSMEEGMAANNSIIGKVKSRVSSIFPNSISKWFSPSTKNNNNDSFNGSINNSGGISRRRRRIEVDEEEDDVDEEDDEEEAEDDEDDDQDAGEFNENLFASQQDRSDDNSDEESYNGEEPVTTFTTSSFKNSRRDMLRSCAVRQPPTKRSRLNLENTIITNNNTNTPLIQRQPLLASTPDVSLGTSSLASGRPATRYKHLNLYANKVGKGSAYNFQSSSVANAMKKSKVPSRYDPDIIDLVPEHAVGADIRSDSAVLRSSRRSLNIPSSANQSSTERGIGFSNLKRQPLASVKNELSLNTSSSLPRRTSTAIFENDSVVADTVSSCQSQNQQQSLTIPDQQEGIEFNDDENEEEDEYEDIQREKSYSGESLTFKRQKLTNGSGQPVFKNVAADLRDSVSESSDGGCKAETTASGSGIQMQRKAAGLFNMSAANSRNGSRTSSFGNGLNFYTHLEGRKSLFAGGGPQAGNNGLTLNNSTLSLNSLNRRQFNASIYGSTSALSDSRLLNTFSPFYKGKTTYGGAAAYNKYITGAGASTVRITPTLIRPTSSLSTLSSSNNSIAAGTHAPENPSAISSTAKRILDLINDFATPLSEAKKMANNLKPLQNQQQLNQSSTKVRRFNETDLNATRAMRLSQVRSPYARPSVTLQPATSVPPVRELQVPSMSQLLQMKKMQHTTERSRQIATEKSCRIGGAAAEYSLPANLESVDSNGMQKQHTNKIKNKVTGSMRITGSKDASGISIDHEAPPTQLNLPNIAFPLMQSIPKFDINLLPGSKTTHSTVNTGKATASHKSLTNAESKNQNMTTAKLTASNVLVASTTETTSITTNFKFSSPLQVAGVTTPAKNIAAINGNYKFSPPMEVGQIEQTKSKVTTAANSVKFSPAQQSQPQLKTGSVLDALKKPFALPGVAANTSIDGALKVNNDDLFAQFKKSTHEWECETCMIRNKEDVSKCVACETPRKHTDVVKTDLPKTVSNSLVESNLKMVSNFGNQFKKPSSEWECETCMIRNKQELSKCVACETPRKQASSSSSSTMGLSSQISLPIRNSFGDKFKPKVNSWECGTCLINNKAEANECVACQTKKPGSANSTAPMKNDVPSPTAIDVGFKSLAAAQKVSKWECEACMTRNDAAKLKCVCCEQAKPGALPLGEEVPKFSFGSTSASKFSFGFGTQNAPKEEELRKLKESTASDAQVKSAVPVSGFVFGASSAAASETTQPSKSSGGFSFGIQPTVETKKPSIGKDIADSSKATDISPLTGSKFCAAASLSVTTSSSALTSTTAITSGLVFGTGTSSTATKSSKNQTSSVSPSVKFSLPTTSIASFGSSNPAAAASTTTIGSSSSTTQQDPAKSFKSVQQAPTSGFSFGLSKPFDTAALTPEAPKSSAFAFKSPATTTTSASEGSAFTLSSTPKSVTTSIASATTSTAVSKPMFSFGAATANNSSAVTAEPTISVSSVKTNSGGFSFGSIAASGSQAPPKSSIFGAVTPVTTATTAVSSSTTLPQPITNVFGSFATASTNNTFGSSSPNLSSAMSQGSNSSTTFGTLAPAAGTTSLSLFSSNSNAPKPKATATISAFGAPITAATVASTPFGFGSSTTKATLAGNTETATAAPTSSTAWPKNSFVFGASSTTSPAPAVTTSSTSEEPVKPPTFGSSSFGASFKPTTNNATSSIFGSNQQTSVSSNLTSSTTFGSSASTPIFGLNSAPALAAVAPTNNLFGSTVAANASTPTFGSSPFGGKNVSVGVTSTFGNTSLSAGNSGTSSFSGFGGVSQVASNSTDGASAAKKSEPAFNFGATSSSQTGTSAGFNFGSAAAATKPAFNFGASNTSAASFNFSGTTADTSKSTQPFQFGATPAPLAPVFNFRGGAVEATPNAPFQFNAGAAQPASSNIFAPSPTPPGVQTAQQARRKIRAPMRRLTPR